MSHAPEAVAESEAAVRLIEFRGCIAQDGDWSYRAMFARGPELEVYYGYPDAPLGERRRTRWVNRDGLYPTSGMQTFLHGQERDYQQRRATALHLPIDDPQRLAVLVRLAKDLWGDP